jgi:protein ImuB
MSDAIGRLFAALSVPLVADAATGSLLMETAADFSPRFERHRDNLVSIDVGGLERLLGTPETIGGELRRDAATRGITANVSVAGTWQAALLLALGMPGVTVVPRGAEAASLAAIPLTVLESLPDDGGKGKADTTISASVLAAIRHWGIRTLGEFAALPPGDVAARLGRAGARWQAIARGEDLRPLCPTLADERFDGTIELEWPIEALEPLSFVLTRLLEPLSTRLERRDRGAAALYLELGLTTKEVYVRRLELPTPMRDVRTLRTLLLLDLEAHPLTGAVDRVSLTIDPTPGRIVQHTLFARPHPTPEQLSTLLARLNALMGGDRVGAPVAVDSYRPGAFGMQPFALEHPPSLACDRARASASPEPLDTSPEPLATSSVSALRRCRPPVPARARIDDDGCPVRITTDRRGFAGGAVLGCAGPWRTSGAWWQDSAGGAGRAGEAGEWNRDEWDVALSDGAMYRVFRDRLTDAWFIDAIVD